MPAKKKTAKISKSIKTVKAQRTLKVVAAPPYPQQNTFRITNPNIRKIGHNMGGFLPKYRRAG